MASGNGKPGGIRQTAAESKAETTKRISEEILRTEAEQREAKTARLKAARLAMLAAKDDAPSPKAGRK